MKRRVWILLLSIVMVLSLVACGGGSQETVPTTAPTQATVPTTLPTQPPEPTPAEVYIQAAQALGQADELRFSLQVKDTRQVGGQTFVWQSLENTFVDAPGSESPKVARQLSYGWADGVLELGDTYEYYLDGKAYFAYADLSHVYSQEVSWQQYRADRIPLQMLDPANYASVMEDGDTITFTNANAAESWTGEDTKCLSASGKAVLKDGQLTECSYTLQYSHQNIQGQLTVTWSLLQQDQLPAPQWPAYKAQELKTVQDLWGVKMLTLGMSALDQTDSYHISQQNQITVEAGALSYFDGSEYYVFGQDTKLTANLEMMQGSEYTKRQQEEFYRDGKLTYYFDDEKQNEYVLEPDFVFDIYRRAWCMGVPQPKYVSGIAVEDLGDTCKITFSGSNEWGKQLQRDTCEDLYENPGILDDMASKYYTNTLEGTVYIDKITWLPISWDTSYKGTHNIQGTGYAVSREILVNLDLLGADAHEEIYDQLPAEEQPQQQAKPLFYHVTGPNGESMWLLGTIHVGDARTAYLPQEIYDALNTSDALAVEIDLHTVEDLLETDEKLLQAVADSYYYRDGTTIGKHLTSELYKKALEAMQKAGGHNVYSEMMKPMLWTQVLGERYMALDGRLAYSKGVDNRLLYLAEAQNKKIYSIEDIQNHMTFTTDYSDKVQSFMLADTLEATRLEYVNGVVELYELWCQGDEKTLFEALQEDLSQLTAEELEIYNEYNKAMMTDRNKEMVTKAKAYLQSSETVFFAVGLAHLTGEDGLVQCLRDAGFTVEMVSYLG
jgi:uncharacterized protein YbaP (TraB family)